MIRYNSVAYADIEGDLAVTQCYQNSMEFPRVHRRVVEARFDGGEITCDGGALLLRQADRYLGFDAGGGRGAVRPTSSQKLCSRCALVGAPTCLRGGVGV